MIGFNVFLFFSLLKMESENKKDDRIVESGSLKEDHNDRMVESCEKFLESIKEESIINPTDQWLLERISELYDWIDYYEYELNVLREKRRNAKGYVPVLPLKTGL